MQQEVIYIKLSDLVLWTENPRDPIISSANDQDIVNQAVKDELSKWNLPKLAEQMGNLYDFSELPTVVYHDTKPVVYDGNRRIIIGKIKLGLVQCDLSVFSRLPDYPEEIPCNVCEEKIALNNIYRKHSDSGSWQPLERDIFVHKHMGGEKSTFLILEEQTGIISANPHLNQRFVKEEIFKDETLNTLGFGIENGRLLTTHSNEDARNILDDVSRKVKNKDITTRKNRGNVLDILDRGSQELIEQNKNNQPHVSEINFSTTGDSDKTKRRSRRISPKVTEFFGQRLYLKPGDVSNLYRDIVDLYGFYLDNRATLSLQFPSLIRMSLRLICETASKDCGKKKLDDFVSDYFKKAKELLTQDIKTMLSNQNVTETSLVQLLHTGAHNYQTSNNIEQTTAISIIIGAMLTISHGKDN